MFHHRLPAGKVRKIINEILNEGGEIEFTSYCQRRMFEREISTATVLSVLFRGVVYEGEEYTHNGVSQWRYRVETKRYRVVVAFETENEILVINTIDFQKRD